MIATQPHLETAETALQIPLSDNGQLIVFLAGPSITEDSNSEDSQFMAKHSLIYRGHLPVVPEQLIASYTTYHSFCDVAVMYLRLIERCDAMLMLPLWHRSELARFWRKHAIAHQKQLFYCPKLPKPISEYESRAGVDG